MLKVRVQILPKANRRMDSVQRFLTPSIEAKICRYNTTGFVEELPQLPEIAGINRYSHACTALDGVRPVQSTFKTCKLCRLLLLLEDTVITVKHPFLLCSPSSLGQQHGLPLPPYHVDCPVLKLPLWEAGSGLMGVGMGWDGLEILRDPR